MRCSLAPPINKRWSYEHDPVEIRFNIKLLVTSIILFRLGETNVCRSTFSSHKCYEGSVIPHSFLKVTNISLNKKKRISFLFETTLFGSLT